MRSTRAQGSRPLRSFAVRTVLGMVAVQAGVVSTLVATDAIQRRSRSRRSGACC